MALTDENGGVPATMLVSPTGGYGNNGGMGGFGDSGWWIVLLFILLAANGGWGNQMGGFGGGMPIVVNDGNGGNVQRGFDQAAVMGGLNGIQNGVQGLATQLCNCCGNMQQTVNAGFANAEMAANARQMANVQQLFGLQTQAADLRYTVATENCADRAALSDGVRDIITNQTANTQRILDQLCADKIDAKNDLIAQLRQELLYARGQASQDVQTANLRAGQLAAVDALYARMQACPVPTMPVYGSQPIFTCNNGGCGCNA